MGTIHRLAHPVDTLRRVRALRSDNVRLAAEAQALRDTLARVEDEKAELTVHLERMYHPPILLNTLPKSGSVYIITTLQRGLGTSFQKLGRGTFPVDMIDGDQLAAFGGSRVVSQEHLDASAYNLTMLARVVGRVAVHFRDPRAASYSWMHHLTGLMRSAPEYERRHGLLLPPEDYADASESDRMAWIVDHHFPSCIQWMRDWIAAADGESATPGADRLKVELFTYEAFVADAAAYFDRLLDYFGVAPERFRLLEVERTKATNFRSAKKGEWRGVGDPLAERMTQQIPDEWFDRFGWPR